MQDSQQMTSTDTDDLLSGLYYAVLAAQTRCIKALKWVQATCAAAESKNINTVQHDGKKIHTRSHSKRDEHEKPLSPVDKALKDPETLELVRTTLAEATTWTILWESAITSGKAQATAVLSPDLFHSIAELLRDCVADVRKLELSINHQESRNDSEQGLKILDSWLEKTAYILQTDLIDFRCGELSTAGTDGDDSKSIASSNSEDSPEEVVHSLAENVRLLMDLLPSIDRLPSVESLDPHKKSLQNSEFEVSAPARVWISQVRASYEKAADEVVERLGEANWQRFCRLRLEVDQGASNELGSAKSVFHAASTFYDSALGTSIGPKSDTQTVASHSSFVSSHNDDTRHHNRVPIEPREVALQKPFTCTVCRQLVKGIRNRIDWKMHIFKDLEPYICLHTDCSTKLKTYRTRKAWSDHDLNEHRRLTTFHCHDCGSFSKTKESFNTHIKHSHDQLNTAQREALIAAASYAKFTEPQTWQCPLCLSTGFPSARNFTSHTCGHMEDIALATLPREMYSSDDDEDTAASNFSGSIKESIDMNAETNVHTERRDSEKWQDRIAKPHNCDMCPVESNKAFATVNDLIRHKKTAHKYISRGERVWKCNIDKCKDGVKIWSRLDNFKQHIKRMHGEHAVAGVEGMYVAYDPDKHGFTAVATSVGQKHTGLAQERSREDKLSIQPLSETTASGMPNVILPGLEKYASNTYKDNGNAQGASDRNKALATIPRMRTLHGKRDEM